MSFSLSNSLNDFPLPANEANPPEVPLNALKAPLVGAFTGVVVELTGVKADLAAPGKEVAPNFGAKPLGGGFVGVVDANFPNTAVGVVDVSPFWKKGDVSEMPPKAPKPAAGLTGVVKLLKALAGGGWAGVVEIGVEPLFIGDAGGDMSSSTGKADLTSTMGSGDDGGDPPVTFGLNVSFFPCPKADVGVVPNVAGFPANPPNPPLAGAVGGFEGVVNAFGPLEENAANPPDPGVVGVEKFGLLKDG